MTSSELRRKYLDFFKKNGHEIIPSASLIPENDSSTLFISSGMQPLVPYLLGEKHPQGNRLANSQKSLRTEDIDEVGDNLHTTFFEMLGNWSLGDYFKKEQLNWIFEFLVKDLEIDPKRLYSTVFRGEEKIGVSKDEESVNILKQVFKKYKIEAKDIDFPEENGMQDGRIFYYSARKCWWSKSGTPEKMPLSEIGGPDSEIFYDLGAELKRHENSEFRDLPCHVNCDCGRFVEIGNSVFIEYKKIENGFKKLKQYNVDFGGGLERLTMVVQGKNNVFETDLFSDLIKKIEELSGKKYEENKNSFRIIVDHIRAATFIIGDVRGITPSNLGQGYIVRRLIRRAIRFGKKIGIGKDGWLKEVAEVVAINYEDVYPEIKDNLDFISAELTKEEEKFILTLEKGLKEFEKLNNVSGTDAFNLYQTYGFPIEITAELAKEKGINVNVEEFRNELEKHQELSRTASAGMFKGGLADNSEATTKLHTAAHLMLAGLRKVLGDEVYQKGSNITAERLRFDFSHKEKMTGEQLKDVENFVNGIIEKDLPVWFEEMPLEKAKEINAMGVFESKYGQNVKVYFIGKGDKNVSREICGGPHVEHTGILGKFKILKEESSSSGIRRIKAILE
ncbi:MAG: alanine--tRNA ligase [Candidatus Staskawiczbacteria bacterium]|nr:alanine--tRNA ligase [Candidatus Staskawiczbacteria bacterium]